MKFSILLGIFLTEYFTNVIIVKKNLKKNIITNLTN